MNEIKKIYYTAKDLSEMLGISKAKAYDIIRQLNEELKASGYIVLQGKIPKSYFGKKWYGLNEEQLTEGA